MELKVLNLFTHTLDALLIYYFLIRLLGYKNKINYEKIYLVALIIINFFISMLFGNAEFLSYILIVTISTFVYSYLLNNEFIKILVYTIFATIVMSLIEVIASGIIVLIFNINPSMILEGNIYRIIAIIISKSIFYLIIKYLIRSFKMPVYFKSKNTKLIALIFTFNMVFWFVLVNLFKYMEVSSTRDYIYLITMSLVGLLFSFIVYVIINKGIYQNQQKKVWEVKEEEFYKNDFYIKSMEDILETIKSQRHDLNNYLSTLYGLIYLKKFDDAKRYIEEINDEINNLNVIIDTNHPIITALVSIKKNKAFDNNIEMNLDIELPKEIDFQFVDLSIVIGNLLDNAIEACQLIPEDKKRKINFKMYLKGEVLIMETKNTMIRSENIYNEYRSRKFTTKDDSESHGYGLGNIEFVVKQYNGDMQITDLEDEFIINIELPMDVHKHSFA